MGDDPGASQARGLAALGLVLYGATVALFVAGQLSRVVLAHASGSAAVLVWGPAIEEALKVAGVALATVLVRGPGDGARFGLAAGLGFGLGEAFVQATTEGPVAFLFRLLASPMHAGAGMLGGLGYALAIRQGRPWVLGPAWLAAVTLHGLFNFCAVHGLGWGNLLVVLVGAALVGAGLTMDAAEPTPTLRWGTRTRRRTWR